jgi:probable rRNA maturation factor
VIYIEIDERYGDLISADLLQAAAQKTLQLDQFEELPSLSIKVTGDQEIRELNSAYRGIDKTTDVLSFEADYYDPDLESRYLGDVVISFPQAAGQAQKSGHPVESELQLLIIHGVLHLLGYDHGSEEEKETMWKVQDQTLNALGLDIVVEDDELN